MILRVAFLGMIALLTAAASPARAAWLGYRNDSNVVIIVQTGCLVNNQPRWGKAQRLYPGEVAWENVADDNKKLICNVYDAKERSRPVLQQPIAHEGKDLFFAVLVEQPPPAKPGDKPRPPVAKLVPARPPARAPGMASGAQMPRR